MINIGGELPTHLKGRGFVFHPHSSESSDEVLRESIRFAYHSGCTLLATEYTGRYSSCHICHCGHRSKVSQLKFNWWFNYHIRQKHLASSLSNWSMILRISPASTYK